MPLLRDPDYEEAKESGGAREAEEAAGGEGDEVARLPEQVGRHDCEAVHENCPPQQQVYHTRPESWTFYKTSFWTHFYIFAHSTKPLISKVLN